MAEKWDDNYVVIHFNDWAHQTWYIVIKSYLSILLTVGYSKTNFEIKIWFLKYNWNTFDFSTHLTQRAVAFLFKIKAGDNPALFPMEKKFHWRFKKFFISHPGLQVTLK